MVHFLGNQSFDNLLEVEPSERESGLKGKWFKGKVVFKLYKA